MTTINDILGHKCIFKERMRVKNECRDCTGRDYKCDCYISQKKAILPKDYHDWIRQCNDRGVI